VRAALSAAAEQYVNACTHPKVKGGVRALLKAIASHIPEGQTTTPPMSQDELAATTQHADRTVRRGLDLLVTIGEIKVHDGGRGKVARYEMLGLSEGARPLTTAPLPLLGRPKLPRGPHRTKVQRSTSDLLSYVDAPTSDIVSDVLPVRAYTIGSFVRRWRANIGSFVRRCVAWTKVQRSTSDLLSDVSTVRTIEQRSTSDILSYVDPPTTSSTYVRSVEEVDARARETQTFLAWWLTAYPLHNHGALSTVDPARDGSIVRALLDQGRTVPRLEALAKTLWGITTEDPWIARADNDRSIRVLQHKVNFLERELARTRLATDDVWQDVLREIESRVNRHTYHTWWKDSTLVDDRGAVVVVRMHPEPTQHELRAQWASKHFADVLTASVAAVRPGTRVEFTMAAAAQRKSG
jgi:hypothetical protein